MKFGKTLSIIAITAGLFTSAFADSRYDYKKLESNFVSWGVNPNNEKVAINLKAAWNNFNKKKEVIVAVVDTGIDPNHPFLANNIYVVNGTAGQRNYGIDFSTGRESKFRPMDQHGHGTHVSGIIKSIFPEVKILPLKYYNPNASGADNLTATVEALKYAVDHNVDIINYSGGGPEPSLEELKVLKEAERKGILVVAAAGNEESNIDKKSSRYFPASYGLSNIITVTAYNQELKVTAPFNYGSKSVDIAAPGYRIKSALPFGRAGYLTGTSQATAFVSGVAALLKSQNPSLDAKEMKKIIMKSAKQEISLMGKCSTAGKLDAAKALSLSGQNSNPERKVAAQGRIIYRKAN